MALSRSFLLPAFVAVVVALAEAKEYQFVWGHRQKPQDRLVIDRWLESPPIPFAKQMWEKTLQVPPNYVITKVEVFDDWKNGAKATLLEGGPGYDFVKLRLQSPGPFLRRRFVMRVFAMPKE